MNGIVNWFKAADRYCFGYGSPTALGLFRIGAGFLLFVNFVMIGGFWNVWYSEQGYVPGYLGSLWMAPRTPLPSFLGTMFPSGIPRIDVIGGVTDPRILIPFYVITTLAALFVCLGLGTRYATFVLFIGMVSLHHRNGIILHGGDTVMRLVVFYLAIAPCGAACSVDRLMGIWSKRVSLEPVQVPVWGQRLIAFNTALIYFTTVWLKWDGDKWRHLTATYYPARLGEFYRFPVPDFIQSVWFSKITTAGTLAAEFSLATLVFFPPARKYVIVAGILMHSLIEYSMNIPLFSFIMITSYITFFEGEEVSAWAVSTGQKLRKFHVTVRLPRGKKLTLRGIALFSAIDPFGFISFLPGEGAVTSATQFGDKAISVSRAISTRCPGGWIFLWIPGMVHRVLTQCLEDSATPNPIEPPERRANRNQSGGTSKRQQRESQRGSLNA